MRKISKQIFKGYLNHDYFNTFLSYLNNIAFVLFSLFFSVLDLDFIIFTFWYSIKYLENKLGISTIGQTDKAVFTAQFLTVANTLLGCGPKN